MIVASPAQTIRNEALHLGFDAVGFSSADLAVEIGENLREFCARGLHGDMGWLSEKSELRCHPQNLWPQAKTVIALALSYPGPDDDTTPPDAARISVYARNRDYHDVMKKKLRRLASVIVELGGELKLFVDTAPLMEKPLAQNAGLGWQGKHTNLVSRDLGSWFFLGIILTDLDLSPDGPEQDHCGSCQACLDVCPTKAFLGPHRLDATKCVSYLTIEHAGPIPHALRKDIGNRIYGCDDCLAVCPWNKFAQAAREEAFAPRPELAAPLLGDFLAMDDPAFRRFFSGSPIKRIGRNRFLRNVLYAAGNSNDKKLIPLIRPLIDDSSPLVRGAAVWALGALSVSELQKARLEPDAEQLVEEEWRHAFGKKPGA